MADLPRIKATAQVGAESNGAMFHCGTMLSVSKPLDPAWTLKRAMFPIPRSPAGSLQQADNPPRLRSDGSTVGAFSSLRPRRRIPRRGGEERVRKRARGVVKGRRPHRRGRRGGYPPFAHRDFGCLGDRRRGQGVDNPVNAVPLIKEGVSLHVVSGSVLDVLTRMPTSNRAPQRATRRWIETGDVSNPETQSGETAGLRLAAGVPRQPAPGVSPARADRD